MSNLHNTTTGKTQVDSAGEEPNIALYKDKDDGIGEHKLMSYPEFADMMRHQVGDKAGSLFSPVTFKGKRQKELAHRRHRIVLDVEYNEKIGVVPPPPEQVESIIRERGWQALIYTSHSHTPAMPRYRVVIEIDEPVTYSTEPEQRAIDMGVDRHMILAVAEKLDLLEVIDMSKLVPSSIFYRPRCPANRWQDARVFPVEGRPINTASLLNKARHHLNAELEKRKQQVAEAKQAAEERAAQRQAKGMTPGEARLIEPLRRALPNLADAMRMRGYEYFQHADRWLHPNSTTGEPGIIIMKGDDGIDRLISFHGCDPLHWESGAFGTKAHDVIDLIIASDHGVTDADRRAGLHALAKQYQIDAEPDPWKGERDSQDDPFAEMDDIEVDEFEPPKVAPTPRKAAAWNPWLSPVAPQFPVDVLPADIRQYVEARGQETGACRSAIAMACIAVASGAITHEARIYLKPGKSFSVSPRLWVMLVGDPSTKKSPVINGAKEPLEQFQKRHQGAAMAAWRAEQQRAEAAGEKKPKGGPDLKHFVINDTTPEKLAEVLSNQNRGTLVVADELAGWLGALDRYGSGKGASSARAIWLQAYSGGPYSLLRVARETIPVENLSTSILGGIQLKRLQEIDGLTSDGLLQRFLPVLLSSSSVDSDTFNHSASEAWGARVRDLLSYGKFSTELTPEARVERRRVADMFHQLEHGDSEGDSWQGFVGKMAGVWGSLALILHLLWGHRAGEPVTLETAARASRLIEAFLLPHGLVFYRSITGAWQANTRAIAGFLAAWKGDMIGIRDLGRGPRCCRGVPPEAIVGMMAPFETGGWVSPEKPGQWNKKWHVAPGLAEQFAAELLKHQASIAAIQANISGIDNEE